jgi:hypothetical protein
MKFAASILFCILALFAATPRLEAAPLETLLNAETVWKLTRETFPAQARPFGFRWTSEQRDSARSAFPGLTFLGQRVYEVVVRFDGEALKAVTVLLYGRGDAGDMAKGAFEELLRNSIAAVDGYTGKKFTPRGRDTTSAVKADGVLWETDKAHYTLEYSFTKENKAKRQDYRAEFIRLELAPPAERKPLLTATAPTPKTRLDPRSQVKRDAATGDVWIPTVPMVDQGQKGYCAVACAERMLRYYGVDVDANEVAQIANSSADGGTSARAMFEALKKLTSRFRVRVQPVEEFDARDYQKLITDYNRAAKRAKAAPIPDDSFIIDVGMVYQMMDAELLKEVKTKNASTVSRFLRNVQANIDAGTPLLWSVQLGKFPERGVPQSGGGHMRLLIGYNLKTNEVIFSDSWGRGHEMKRMPMANALTITTGMTVMEPVGS